MAGRPGRTGHDKSTLLNLLGGLDRPARGTIELDGNLDEIIALLERLWRERGLTLVLVTRDTSLARRAQRAAVMNNGHVTIGQDPQRLGLALHRSVGWRNSSPGRYLWRHAQC